MPQLLLLLQAQAGKACLESGLSMAKVTWCVQSVKNHVISPKSSIMRSFNILLHADKILIWHKLVTNLSDTDFEKLYNKYPCL